MKIRNLIAILMLNFLATPVSGQTPPAAAEKETAVRDEAAVKTAQQQDHEAMRRAAEAERVKEQQRVRDELMKLCVIKPVMTDDEINACKKAYRA